MTTMVHNHSIGHVPLCFSPSNKPHPHNIPHSSQGTQRVDNPRHDPLLTPSPYSMMSEISPENGSGGAASDCSLGSGANNGVSVIVENWIQTDSPLASPNLFAAKRGWRLPPDPCPVCGDVSTGHHYGIDCCESCKGFFRRVVQQKQNYSCKWTSECSVTKQSRRNCAACRFNKCISLGMLTTSVRENRKRGGCKRRKKLPTTCSSSSSGNCSVIKTGTAGGWGIGSLLSSEMRFKLGSRNFNLMTNSPICHNDYGAPSPSYSITTGDTGGLIIPSPSQPSCNTATFSLPGNYLHSTATSPDGSNLISACVEAYTKFLVPAALTNKDSTSSNCFVTPEGQMVTPFQNLPYADCNVLWTRSVLGNVNGIPQSVHLTCLLHNWVSLSLFDFLLVHAYISPSSTSTTTTTTKTKEETNSHNVIRNSYNTHCNPNSKGGSFVNSPPPPLIGPCFSTSGLLSSPLCSESSAGSCIPDSHPSTTRAQMDNFNKRRDSDETLAANDLTVNGLHFQSILSKLTNQKSVERTTALEHMSRRVNRLCLDVSEVAMTRTIVLLASSCSECRRERLHRTVYVIGTDSNHNHRDVIQDDFACRSDSTNCLMTHVSENSSDLQCIRLGQLSILMELEGYCETKALLSLNSNSGCADTTDGSKTTPVLSTEMFGIQGGRFGDVNVTSPPKFGPILTGLIVPEPTLFRSPELGEPNYHHHHHHQLISEFSNQQHQGSSTASRNLDMSPHGTYSNPNYHSGQVEQNTFSPPLPPRIDGHPKRGRAASQGQSSSQDQSGHNRVPSFTSIFERRPGSCPISSQDVTSSLSAPIPKIDRFYELCLLLCDIDRYVADNLGRVYRGNDVFALLVKRSESPTEIKSTYQKVLNEEGIKLKTGNPNG